MLDSSDAEGSADVEEAEEQRDLPAAVGPSCSSASD